ncbi:MAG: hypothetical protein ACOX2V_04150 [Clostridia bacterium]|jgi:hypothetical protein
MFDTENWQTFEMDKLFNIRAGIYHYSYEYSEGNTPYVSATNNNNGIQQRIDLEPDFKGNCIVTGKIGCTAFYQSEDFCATSDVNIYTARNFKLDRQLGLFFVTIINFSENYKWNYGRQCRIGDSKKIKLKLPIEIAEDGYPVVDKDKKFSAKGFIPDWKYIKDFMNSIENKEKEKIKIILNKGGFYGC